MSCTVVLCGSGQLPQRISLGHYLCGQQPQWRRGEWQGKGLGKGVHPLHEELHAASAQHEHCLLSWGRGRSQFPGFMQHLVNLCAWTWERQQLIKPNSNKQKIICVSRRERQLKINVLNDSEHDFVFSKCSDMILVWLSTNHSRMVIHMDLWLLLVGLLFLFVCLFVCACFFFGGRGVFSVNDPVITVKL